MELGMIGLGRMGASMVLRLQRAGHHCVVYDMSPAAVQAVGELHDTLASTSCLAPLGFGVDSMVHAAPFHSSARVILVLELLA